MPKEKLPDSSASAQPSGVRLIPLTKGKFAIVDAADYGFLAQWKWRAEYQKRSDTWRASRSIWNPLKKRADIIKMHRLIMQAPVGMEVDHEDGDGLHNWRGNLRLATRTQNAWNHGPAKRNTSGYKGVTWDKQGKKWMAQIEVNGRNIYLGRFLDKLDAAKAYANAAAKYHGEFARTEPFKRPA